MVYLHRAIQAPYAAGDVAEEDQLAILLPGHSDWKIGLQIPINLHLAAPLFDPDRGDDESDNRESQDEEIAKARLFNRSADNEQCGTDKEYNCQQIFAALPRFPR